MIRKNLVYIALFFCLQTFSSAAVYLTVPEALKKVFPAGAKVEEKTKFLSESELTQARELSGGRVPIESSLFTYYEARQENRWIGSAYLDTHMVRTLPETVLISVGANGQLGEIEILSFKEPPDYLPPSKWLDQFRGKERKEVAEKGKIRSITGATLTARGIQQAVERTMIFHELIYGKGMK